jgi:hypothetical protein
MTRLRASQMKVTPQQFMELFNVEVDKLKTTFATKGVEYSGETNRLANFIKEGAEAGVEPEIVLGIYIGKHYAAVKQHGKDLNAGFERTLSEPISGRWHDLIAYGFLGLAMALAREGQIAPVVEQPPAPKFVAPAGGGTTDPVAKSANDEAPPMARQDPDKQPMKLDPEIQF